MIEIIGKNLSHPLTDQLVPLREYVDNFIEQYKTVDKIWSGNDWFIPPDICTDEKKVVPALDHVAHWLGKPSENLMTILGDFGTGKTTLANYLAYQLARAFQDDPLHHPAPVLIPLHDVQKAITLESIITTHFQNYHDLANVSYANFEFMLRLGKVILLFDGFDEMAARIRYDTMRDNFRELARAAEHRSKVILTCSTRYFKDPQQEQAKIINESTFTETETELYQDQHQYGTRQQVVYLQLFDDAKIKAYLQRTRPQHVAEDWDKIEHIYDMRGLAERPLLLDTIVKTLPKFDKSQHITAAKLYEYYTNQWIRPENEKKRLLDSDSRLQLMLELAWQMWDSKRNTFFVTKELLPFVERLMGYKMDFRLDMITKEIQTATFFKCENNEFVFMHRSFMEYFLAYEIHACLAKENISVLNTRRLDRKVVYFLTQLDHSNQLKTLLENLLTNAYQPKISENALQIWYWSQRIAAGMEEKITDLAKLQQLLQFPSGMQLQNARLADINLEAATLPQAQLKGAIFFNANLNNCNFLECDLTEAKYELVRENLLAVVQRLHPLKDAIAIYSSDSMWQPLKAAIAIYSSNGVQFVTRCHDNIIEIWRSADYRLLYTSEDYQGGIESVLFDQNYARLTSGSDDGMVERFLGKLPDTLKGNTIRSVAFEPNNAWLASGSGDGTVRLWDLNSGKLLHTIGEQWRYYSVTTVAFDPIHALLAYGNGYENTVRLWNPNSGKLLHTLKGHQYGVLSVAFDPSQTRLASGSSDYTVRLWDSNSGKLLHTLKGHQNRVLSVAFDPNQTRLASGSDDNTVRLWNPNSGKLLHTLGGHQNGVLSVAFDPSQTRLASGSFDKTVRLWDPNSGKLLHTLKGHNDSIWSVAFDPNQTRLASGSDDNTVRLWDSNSGECVAILTSNLGNILSVAFAPNGRYLVAAGSAGRLQFWDLDNSETFLYLYSFGKSAWLALLPDGRFDANPEGMGYLCYTEKGTVNSYRAEELVKEFYDPEGVKGVLRKYS